MTEIFGVITKYLRPNYILSICEVKVNMGGFSLLRGLFNKKVSEAAKREPPVPKKDVQLDVQTIIKGSRNLSTSEIKELAEFFTDLYEFDLD